MKRLTASITAVFFIMGLGLFLPSIQAEPKSPLAGKLFADRKDKAKISHEAKEEMLKKKEEELLQKEEALKKKEEELKAWELRLKKRTRVRRTPPATNPSGVVNLQAPRTTGPAAPGPSAPATPRAPQPGTSR